MIRKWLNDDVEPLLTLWLESTTVAHPFIDAQYWLESKAVVREVYLPSAETWVWEEKGQLRGFISVMESRLSARCLSIRPLRAKGSGMR